MAHPHGIHHITAIASDPQQNVEFYLRTMGLRLVKTTVNFDAPDTYHLYYGNRSGDPGTIITFFPWPGTPRGRQGTGQATTIAFSVPEGSLGWWAEHLRGQGIAVDGPRFRLDGEALSFRDPDGLILELIAHEGPGAGPPWEEGPVPEQHGIRGFHSVTFTEADSDPTEETFGTHLGFTRRDEGDDRVRYEAGAGGAGTIVDILRRPGDPRGLVAAGTVHHVAWRAPDEDTEAGWRDELVGTGYGVTEIIDRQYFKSIYFREPGGVLLEIATDPPGFTRDEPLLELGRELKLPPWLEPNREQISAALPELKIPTINWPDASG
ncbi:MAG: ring-cleaving dioxygenase [Actinobacteria bacterium]|nr:ring-cleaving dioxygenase [Actinomycetota bacterium]